MSDPVVSPLVDSIVSPPTDSSPVDSDSDSSPSSSSSPPSQVVRDSDKINVLNLSAVKTCIDEHISSVLTNSFSFEEDCRMTDLRIIVGSIACLSAVFAYLLTDFIYVSILCTTYVALSLFLQLLFMYVVKDVFFLSKPLLNQVIRVSADFKPSCYHVYVLHFSLLSSSHLSFFSRYSSSNVLFESSIEQDTTLLFTEDGQIDEQAVYDIVNSFVTSANQKKLL
mmetsp:Transcript_12819/g.19313  ORF Transcript_12819/g.19313 Transcript_12819/m.19313 type:complete len:224 (-) Transcript_12819:59-730(-)